MGTYKGQSSECHFGGCTSPETARGARYLTKGDPGLVGSEDIIQLSSESFLSFVVTIAVVFHTYGPSVNVAAWILMVTAILFTLFRLVSNIFLRGRYGQHDWYIIISNAIAIAQVIATSLMVGHGLGQHQDKLSNAELASYQKALLASSVLYIATLVTNKLSLLQFVSEVLAPGQTTLRRAVHASRALLGCYMVAALFTLSFGCSLPQTYNIIGGKCIDFDAFWTVHAVVDIIASLTILILPLIIVVPLQMSISLKSQIIFPFSLEVPLCAFAIVRLLKVRHALAAEDQTWASVDWQVWTQVSMHLGIVAANIPCLKMFLKGFESMLFRQDTTRLQATTFSNSKSGQSADRPGPGWSGWRGNGSGERSDRSARKSRGWKIGNGSELRPGDGETTAIVDASSSGHDITSDAHSDKASGGRDRIYKTTEWTVLGEQNIQH